MSSCNVLVEDEEIVVSVDGHVLGVVSLHRHEWLHFESLVLVVYNNTGARRRYPQGLFC